MAETRPVPVNPTEDSDDVLPKSEHSGFNETMAVPVESTQPGSAGRGPQKPISKKRRWLGNLLWTLAGLLVLAMIAAFSASKAYQEGIEIRKGAQSTQVAQAIAQQYQLALKDMADKQYYRARQRFEYIIQQDPGFPGVTEKLAEVLVELNTTATPTIQPTPTLTPTPDMRGVEEMFSQGSQSIANKDWTTAIDTLLNLRKSDPNYRAVEIDGMLYLALRNRGQDKIGKLADLEGGMYDLALAEKFGPLDAEAQGYMTWASLYITGASFWEINWEQAVYYFSQVGPQMPYLRDGSGMTAQERYRKALIGYGDTLASNGDYCSAQQQYETAYNLNPSAEDLSTIDAALAEAIKGCESGDD